MPNAIEIVVIIGFVLLGLATLVTVALVILNHFGYLNSWWDKARKKIPYFDKPCRNNIDCARYGNHICDPATHQCRLKAYTAGQCSTNSDCLKITPVCMRTQAFGSRPVCTQNPYHALDLFGDPTLRPDGCQGTVGLNTTFNFCQTLLNAACKITDDCLAGACKGGTCTYLGPYDVCTEGSSYALNQCGPTQHCAGKTVVSVQHCQLRGVNPGATGAYCATDADCDNHNCYKPDPGDKVGVCATHAGLIGMPCEKPGDCVIGLECKITPGLTGTCVFSDLSKVTDLKNCPGGQYESLGIGSVGCSAADNPVPCSVPDICRHGCSASTGVSAALIIGVPSSSQIWQQLYPGQSGGDVASFFTNFTQNLAGGFTLNPNFTMLISPFEGANPQRLTYPVINLPINLGPEVLPPVHTDPVDDLQACQPLVASDNLLSSFANESSATMIFQVNYDSTSAVTAAASTVTCALTFPSLNNGNPITFTAASEDLTIYYLANDPTPVALTDYFVYHNYTSSDLLGTAPGAAAWSPPNKPVIWGTNAVFLVPPPTLPDLTDLHGYLADCLRFNTQATQLLPDNPFTHFFYYPLAGETVISSKFSTLPTQGGGGVTTLVGLYEVESGSPPKRVIVVSTAAFYVGNTKEAPPRFSWKSGNTQSLYAQRVPVYTYPGGSDTCLFVAVYSFTLVNFSRDWPFTTTLIGPVSTASDTAGLCTVSFVNSSEGNTAVMNTLSPSSTIIPSSIGACPVFTPRAYSRVQVQDPRRVIQWTNIFRVDPPLDTTDAPTLIDSDMVVTGIAGAHCIVSILLTFAVGPPGGSPPTTRTYTLLLTLRFGDTLATSLYSRRNLDQATELFSGRTKMFTFWLTPEPEESGGRIFPDPPIALAPKDQNSITSWATSPLDFQGANINHSVRTPWGAEVFTATLVPENLTPPVRFFRMPVKSPQALSTQGADDVWIWGRVGDDMVCVPLSYDYYGTIFAINFATPNLPGNGRQWYSANALRCPPSSMTEITLGQDEEYQESAPGPNGQPVIWRFPQWVVSPGIRDGLSGHGFVVDPLPLTGRMCQTSGYQDGLLMRARPYCFYQGEPHTDLALPPWILQLLMTDSPVVLSSLASMAVSLCISKSLQSPSYQDAVPQLGIGGILAMTNDSGFGHPIIPGFFDKSKELIWMGSEGSQTPLLPGGYRTLPCPVNPRAVPFGQDGSYPLGCVDAGLGARKPLSVTTVWKSSPGTGVGAGQLTVVVYEIEMLRVPGDQATARIVSANNVDMHGGLAVMPSYPGSNGGPALVYTPCVGTS